MYVAGNKTDRWIGVCEMLVMTSVGGIIFSLLSAQPLIIVGATGPLLIFEESLYTVSDLSTLAVVIVYLDMYARGTEMAKRLSEKTVSRADMSGIANM